VFLGGWPQAWPRNKAPADALTRQATAHQPRQ